MDTSTGEIGCVANWQELLGEKLYREKLNKNELIPLNGRDLGILRPMTLSARLDWLEENYPDYAPKKGKA